MSTVAVEKSRLSIRKGDQVQVIAGREKGKTGKVLRVDGKNDRLTVEKVNMVKRHVKPNQQNPQGGVIEKESQLHYSNVLLFCQKCNKGVRHGIRVEESKKKGKATASAKKIRFCKKCDGSLEVV